MATLHLLLIDAGNTRVKWATAAARGKSMLHGDVPVGDVTAASLQKLARKFPGHRAVLACVVPKLTAMFQCAFAGRLYTVTGGSPNLPLPFAYPRPAELGADRIAAAAAAHAE